MLRCMHVGISYSSVLFRRCCDQIGTSGRLRSLDLSYNTLERCPSRIWKMSNLETLNLSHNVMTTLTPYIAKLRLLRALTISHNQLAWLPAEVATLGRRNGHHKLQKLDLSGNPFGPVAISPADGVFHFQIPTMMETVAKAYLRSAKSIDFEKLPVNIAGYLKKAGKCTRCTATSTSFEGHLSRVS